MDAEERTRIAIVTTRTLLGDILGDPGPLIMLADRNVLPEDIEDKVYAILAYLEKTAPDKTKETEE